MKLFLHIISSFLLICCNAKKEIPTTPNFLFIVVDDLGYHDLGYTGSKLYESPNIDAIALKSTIFTNGYANSAVCSPSRASLLTGKYVTNHGITDWIGAPSGTAWRSKNRNTKLLPAQYNLTLNKEFTTLPEALKQQDYSTFFAGKWHLGGKEDQSLPTNHGFDINKGGYHHGGPYPGGYFSPFLNPYLKDVDTEKGLPLPLKLANETNTFLEQHQNKPFFAFLSFYGVHAPIQTTRKKWAKYRTKIEKQGIHENGFEMEHMLPIRKHQDNPVYAGLIEQVDDAVGIVINKLKALNLDKNTVIIFTSDNGGVASGDNFSTSNTPLRGGKGYQFEGGIKIPYLISVPWLNQNGIENTTPVSGADLYPTILELSNHSSFKKENIDGASLVPLLNNKKLKNRYLFWHYPHYGNQGGSPNSIIRDNKWKLIYYWEDNHYELYNMDADYAEQNNQFNDQSKISNKLKTKLWKWLHQTNAQFPEKDNLYNKSIEKRTYLKYKDTIMPSLEEQRKQMLKKDWKPNKTWWGSFN